MKWIDLGLPSGTLWAEQNEDGYYKFDEAAKEFGANIPTSAEFDELVKHCWKRWDYKRKGMEFMGPNGAKLFMPAAGYYNMQLSPKVLLVKEDGYYWTISKYKSRFVYYMCFDENYAGVGYNGLHYKRTVRLVKRGGEQ